MSSSLPISTRYLSRAALERFVMLLFILSCLIVLRKRVRSYCKIGDKPNLFVFFGFSAVRRAGFLFWFFVFVRCLSLLCFFLRISYSFLKISWKRFMLSGCSWAKVSMCLILFSSRISSVAMRIPVSSTSPNSWLTAVPKTRIVGLSPM